MNRNTGILGAVAVGAIAIVLSLLPSNRAELPAPGAMQTTDNGASSKVQQQLSSPCREIGKRIAEFFPKQGVLAPHSCVDETKGSGVSLSDLLTLDAAGKVVVMPAAPAPDPSKKSDPELPGLHVLGQPKLRYIIATLPDPVHTHFSLLFDRQTEALQQAAQDQGYNYDGSWLPWSDDSRAYDRLKDQQQADEQSATKENQPGVVVFRKALPSADAKPCQNAIQTSMPCPLPYSDGLIVFIVGENPTGGVNLKQFDNAVAWIKALTTKPTDAAVASLAPKAISPRIRILGPYFSGSFPSLAQALLENSLMVSTAAIRPQLEPMAVFSGTVTSRAGITWFQDFLETSPLNKFYSLQENDDLMIDRYCQYLKKIGYNTGKLAIISEDETAYGGGQVNRQDTDTQQALPHCDEPPGEKTAHGPLYLYYPRDIASLRSAYERQTTGASGSQNQSRDSFMGLPLNLAEPSVRQRDTIRTYGGGETPLSQEATLFGVTHLFSSHNIQFIILRSSNTLDQIFLTRFLSRTYPQARVVLTSADLLFRRSSETAGFRGTMTLTTYPLLTLQQDWTHWQTPESRHSHRAFPEDSAEGLYLATRFLIDVTPDTLSKKNEISNPLESKPSSVVIQDYAPPFWYQPQDSSHPDVSTPPTWLSVIGNEQLWPVAVLDNSIFPKIDATNPPKPDAKNPAPPASTLPWARTSATQSPISLPLQLPIKILLALSFLWALWHFLCCLYGSRTPTYEKVAVARYLAAFAPMKRRQQKTLMFAGSLVMMMVPIILLSLTGVFARDERGSVLVAVVGAICVAGALLGFLLDSRRRQKLWVRPPGLRREATWFLLASVLAWISFYWCTAYQLTAGSAIPSYWRSLNPMNGVSPIMPMLLLTAGLYGWFCCTLGGLALFNDDRPRLPRYPEPENSNYPVARGLKIGYQIERGAIPLSHHYGWHLLIAMAVLIGCGVTVFADPYFDLGSLREAFGIRSLGNIQYGRFFLIYLSLCIGIILLDGWRLLSTWKRLRQLLMGLDELPLRRTLIALKGFSWSSVWNMGGNVLDQRNRLITRQMESLRRLQNQLNDLFRNDPYGGSMVPELDKYFDHCQKSCGNYGKFVEELDNKPHTKSKRKWWRVPTLSDTPLDEMDFPKLRKLQSEFATVAMLVLNKVLLGAWGSEKGTR